MNAFDRFMLVLGTCGYGAPFMVPAVGLVLHGEALDAAQAPRDIESAPASGTCGSRACQGASGRCDAGCHRLNDRRVTRAFARITAGLAPS
ncbi:hypothetical protein [Agromyces aureus]|nr:hypothetical protein [Agromyces aureus]